MCKKLLSLTVCFCVIVILISLLPVHGEAQIYEQVVRLHVLANSDSEEDQALKLCVRDAVLEHSAELLGECTNRTEAEQVIQENMDELCATAQNCVWNAGYDYDVRVRLTREEYPTKDYEAFCFPSGEYLSLQVLIGEGAGQNWWCVLFPPLCLSAATEQRPAEDAFIAAGFTGEQYRIITESDSPTYRVRFKLLETYFSFAKER